MAAHVSWISITPVKSLALDRVDEIDLLESGPRGDRRFYLVDERDRLVNDTGRGAPLQLVHARFADASGELTLRMPDGREVSGPVEHGTAMDRPEVQTTFHRRLKVARRVPGPWDDALSELLGERIRLVAAESSAPDRGRGGAVTLLSTGSLDALARELGVATVDPRRFRMNVGLEGLEPHGEDAWVGRRLSVGDAVLVPQGHVGRCAITTQNPDSGRVDLETLKALAAYRADLVSTEPLPFGVHAAVAQPGRVRVGDSVQLV